MLFVMIPVMLVDGVLKVAASSAFPCNGFCHLETAKKLAGCRTKRMFYDRVIWCR